MRDSAALWRHRTFFSAGLAVEGAATLNGLRGLVSYGALGCLLTGGAGVRTSLQTRSYERSRGCTAGL